MIAQQILILGLKMIKQGLNKISRALIWDKVHLCRPNMTGDMIKNVKTVIFKKCHILHFCSINENSCFFFLRGRTARQAASWSSLGAEDHNVLSHNVLKSLWSSVVWGYRTWDSKGHQTGGLQTRSPQTRGPQTGGSQEGPKTGGPKTGGSPHIIQLSKAAFGLKLVFSLV